MKFTYNEYLELIHKGMENGTQMFVRHDVDISMEKALEMAEKEHKYGVISTYYFLFSSPFYNLMDQKNLDRVKLIKELGHDIGLHYDLDSKMTDEDKITDIIVQIGLLEHRTGQLKNASVTFHKPVTGVDFTAPMVNVLNKHKIYCPNFDAKYKYISDSGHNWREDPLQAIYQHKQLHINVHPEWYNEEELNMDECLYNLRLDVKADERICKEVKHINEYLDRIT